MGRWLDTGLLWDYEPWEDEEDFTRTEAENREYNPDTPDLDIMETY